MKIPKKILWINLCSLAVFIFLLISFKNNFFVRIDSAVNLFMSQIQNPFFISVSQMIAVMFDTTVMIIFSLLFSTFVWFKYSKRDAVFFSFTMLLGGAFIYVMKDFVQRARPINALVLENSFAFPSGHALSAVVFFGLLIYLAFKEKSKRKTNVSLISAFMVVLICFTRLYLNVHWLTDVLGGLALGIFILTGNILLKERIV